MPRTLNPTVLMALIAVVVLIPALPGRLRRPARSSRAWTPANRSTFRASGTTPIAGRRPPISSRSPPAAPPRIENSSRQRGQADAHRRTDPQQVGGAHPDEDAGGGPGEVVHQLGPGARRRVGRGTRGCPRGARRPAANSLRPNRRGALGRGEGWRTTCSWGRSTRSSTGRRARR